MWPLIVVNDSIVSTPSSGTRYTSLKEPAGRFPHDTHFLADELSRSPWIDVCPAHHTRVARGTCLQGIMHHSDRTWVRFVPVHGNFEVSV